MKALFDELNEHVTLLERFSRDFSDVRYLNRMMEDDKLDEVFKMRHEDVLGEMSRLKKAAKIKALFASMNYLRSYFQEHAEEINRLFAKYEIYIEDRLNDLMQVEEE